MKKKGRKKRQDKKRKKVNTEDGIEVIDDFDGEIPFKDLKGEIVQFIDSGIIIRTVKGFDVQNEKWGRNTGSRRVGSVYKVHPVKRTVNIKCPASTAFAKRYDVPSTLYRNVPLKSLICVLRPDDLGGGSDKLRISE